MAIGRKQSRAVSTTEVSDCVTLDLGLEGFLECPQIGPNTCAFAVPFGYGFLCEKPEFVAVPQEGRAKGSATTARTTRTG